MVQGIFTLDAPKTMASLIDLTHPIKNGIPVYPGDRGVILSSDSLHGFAPDGCRMAHVGRANIGLHNGTHMDAPFHFLPDGFTIEKTPMERCIAKTTLLNLAWLTPRAEIRPEHFTGHELAISENASLVIRTDWSKRWLQPDYFTSHPYIGLDAAHWLLNKGVKMVGLDFPSIDHPPFDTHILWLGAGASILENLTNLDRISGTSFTLIALPLPFVGMDGSPVRAVALLD